MIINDSLLNFVFYMFLIPVQKCDRFLCVDLVPYDLAELTNQFQQVLGVRFLEIFQIINYFICKQAEFYFFIYNLYVFYFFSCLTSLARSSKTMLYKSGENRFSTFIPNLRGKEFSLSSLCTTLVMVFCRCPLSS